MPESSVILNAAAIQRALVRIAHEIAERNESSREVVIIGIQRGGVHLAERLCKILGTIWGHSVPMGKLDVSMHRDDLDRILAPDVQPTVIPGSRGILCPYCGTISASDPRRCDRCGGFFDPLSRQATQNAMGPWSIRDTANPFRPGCSFETVRDLIKRGKVTRETILRGPSTRQYWNFAARTPGIALPPEG